MFVRQESRQRVGEPVGSRLLELEKVHRAACCQFRTGGPSTKSYAGASVHMSERVSKYVLVPIPRMLAKSKIWLTMDAMWLMFVPKEAPLATDMVWGIDTGILGDNCSDPTQSLLSTSSLDS